MAFHDVARFMLLRARTCTDWPEILFGGQEVCWHLKFRICKESVKGLWRNWCFIGSVRFHHGCSRFVLLRARTCTDWPEIFFGGQGIWLDLKFKIWERSVKGLWRNRRFKKVLQKCYKQTDKQTNRQTKWHHHFLSCLSQLKIRLHTHTRTIKVTSSLLELLVAAKNKTTHIHTYTHTHKHTKWYRHFLSCLSQLKMLE